MAQDPHRPEWYGERTVFRFFNHFSPNMTHEIIADNFDQAINKLEIILGSAGRKLHFADWNFCTEPYWDDERKDKTSAIGFRAYPEDIDSGD